MSKAVVTVGKKFRVFHQDRFLGIIEDHNYETPWVTGRLVPSGDVFDRYIAISDFLSWIDLCSDDMSDEAYDEELKKRGLDDGDVSELNSGWQFIDEENILHPVSSLQIYPDGMLQWRWAH